MDVRGLFGMKVAEMVEAVTDPPGFPNRKTRKAAVYEKLRYASPEARAVKLADRIANLRASIIEGQEGLASMYRKKYPDFRVALMNLGEHNAMWQELNKLHGEKIS